MRMAAAAVVLCAAAVAVFAISGWPADRYRHNDFMGFWASGRAIVEGTDPYDVPTWLELHRREGSRGLAIVPPATGFGYPLTTAIVFAPFALLPIALAAPLWFVAQVALALVALAALGQRLFAGTLRRDLIVLVTFAATSQPAWVLAEGGNVGGFVLAIAAGSLTLLLAGRPLAAGALAGLVAVKPHLFLWAIPFVLIALPRAVALRLAAGALAVGGSLIAMSLALRPAWVAEWLVSLARIQGAPVGRATVFGLFPPGMRTLGWVVVAAILIAFVWWVRTRRPPVATAVSVALSVSLFLAPYGWSYDHTILFTAAAVTIALVAHVADRPRAEVLALLALVTVPLPWLLYVTAFSRGEEAWSAVVPLAVVGVLAVASRQRGATILA